MSGLEVAGLVLGAFPLLLKALSGYLDGCRKTNELFHFTVEIEQLKNQLDIEYVFFHNICESLLEDSVSVKQLDRLLYPDKHEDAKALWLSQEIHLALEDKLRQRTITTFVRNVIALNASLGELSQKFPVNYTKKKPFSRKRIKMVLQGVKFVAFSTTSREALTRIKEINVVLERLVSGGSLTETHYATKAVRLYHQVQEGASDLLNVLTENVRSTLCECDSSHTAALRLEIRDVDHHDEASSQRKDQNQLMRLRHEYSIRFRIFLSLNNAESGDVWREFDVEPVSDDANAQEDPALITEPSSPHETVQNDRTLGDVRPTSLVHGNPPLTSSSPISYNTSLMIGFYRRYVRNLMSKTRISSTPDPKPSGPVMFLPGTNSTSLAPRNGSMIRASVPGPTHSGQANNGTIALVSESNSAPDITLPSGTRVASPDVSTFEFFCKALLRGSFPQSNQSCYIKSALVPHKYHRIQTSVYNPIINGSRAPAQDTTNLRALLKSGHRFTRKQKLQIGLKLTSSVLQLYSSGWMDEWWDAGDVEFLQVSGGAVIESPILSVRRSPRKKKLPRLPFVGNPTLFSLGIVLIELMYNRCLDDCPRGVLMDEEEEESAVHMDDVTKQYDHATRLITLIRYEEGSLYEMAVRRCVKGLDHPETSLKNDDYKKAVYCDVLGPLKATYQRSFGE